MENENLNKNVKKNKKTNKKKKKKIISEDKLLSLLLLYCCIVIDIILEFFVFLFKWSISLNAVYLVFLKCGVSLFSIALSTTIALEGLKDPAKNSILLKRKSFFIIAAVVGYCFSNLLISWRYNDSNTEWYHFLIDGGMLFIVLSVGIWLSIVVLKTYFVYKKEKDEEIITVNKNIVYKGDPNALDEDKAKATADMVNSFANLDVEG